MRDNVIRLILLFFIAIIGLYISATVEATPVDGYTYLGKITIDHVRTAFPERIALDSGGTLYVVDGYNHHVMKYDRAGNYIGEIRVENASAVAVAPDGRVYIGANGESPLVGIYEGDILVGYLGSGPGEFSSVRDIAVDEQSGDVYVVDSIRNVVSVYTASGQHIRDIGGLSYPQAVDVEASEVYIVDAPVVKDPTGGGNTTSVRVSVYDSGGQLLRSFEDFLAFGGRMVRPQDITVTPDGYLLIPEAISEAVLVYDTAGNYIGEIKSESERLYIPRSTALGGDKRLYVSSNMTKSILIFGLYGYTYLQVNPKSLSFVSQSGVAPAGQAISVSNLGTGTLSFGVTATEGWIQLSSSGGVLGPAESTEVQVGIDVSGLEPGSYAGKVVVTSGSGATEEVVVELQVLQPPRISVSPTELYFTALAGGSNPPSQVLFIQIEGDITGQVQWSATAEGGWLSITPTTGMGDTVTQALVSVDITGLVAGVYNGRVVIEASGVSNSPVEVPVVLELSSSGRIHVVTNLAEARFKITGPVSYEGSGTDWSVEGVPDGTYRIEYYDISGYIKPSSEEKVLSGGGEIEFRGEYRRAKDRILVSYDTGKRRPTVIKVLDETGAELRSINAFSDSTGGGVGTAVGDIDGDGYGEVVAGLLKGSSEVVLYEGIGEEMGKFIVFDGKEGVEVTAGDVNGDGVDEVVVAGRKDGRVRVFSYDAGEVIDTGVYFRVSTERIERVVVATCDIDADMVDEIVTVVVGKESAVAKIWEVNTSAGAGNWTAGEAVEFGVYEKGIMGAECTDRDADGVEEVYLVTDSEVVGYDAEGQKVAVVVKSTGLRSIGIGDIDGDGVKDVVVGKGDGRVEVWSIDGQKQRVLRVFDTLSGVRVSIGELGL
jgi:hypothetical protein